MGKRLEITPNSQIKAAVHRLWLRSRERAAALKRDKRTCQCCSAKASVAKGREQKVEVHHLNGIDWSKITEYIRRHVLTDPKNLQTLCPDCHSRETACQVAEDAGL
jgi:5-methylcytosine-specific restriction endonuclease McrA